MLSASVGSQKRYPFAEIRPEASLGHPRRWQNEFQIGENSNGGRARLA